MSTFNKYLRSLIERAEREAQVDQSTTIEAQHLLLAIAAQPDTIVGQLLCAAGLGHAQLRDALAREYEQSLAAAGVSLAGFELPAATARPRAAKLGASVRQALERGVAGIRKGPRPEHLLLGILEAQRGTVPRALDRAGIDRVELVRRAKAALAA